MRMFFRSMALTVKRLLRRRGAPVIWALFLLLCGGVSLFFARGESALEVRAGVAFDPSDPFAAAVFETLGRIESPVRFERYTLGDEQLLRQEVRAGRLECAYLLSPNLYEELGGGRGKSGVTLLKSPSTVADLYASELLFSAILYQNAPRLDRELIAEVLGLDETRAAEFAAERFEYYAQNDGIALRPVYSYNAPSGTVQQSPPPAGARLLHGIVSLFLLVDTLFSLPGFIEEKGAPTRRMNRAMTAEYRLGICGALFVFGMLQGTLALTVIRILYPAALTAFLVELAWLAAYQLAIGLFGGAVSLSLRRSGSLYTGVVLLLPVTALLGGIALDLGEISPTLGSVTRFFPTGSYIGGVLTGRAEYLIPLAVLSALSTLIVLTRTLVAPPTDPRQRG